MKKKILLILLFMASILLVACTNNTKTIVGIKISGEDTFSVEDFNIEEVKIKVSYSTNTYVIKNISKSMVSEKDLEKLATVGKHEITITYNDFSADIIINITSTDGSFKVVIVCDDEILLDEIYTEATIITAPNDPVKEGYVFLGWYDNDLKVDFSVAINENLYVEAQFEQIMLTVDFLVDGELYQSLEVGYGENISEIPTATKDGYIFLGWDIELANLIIKEDLTVNAKFSKVINEYSVKFLVDGEVIDELTVEYGDYITASSHIPTKDGYEFVGWDYDFAYAVFDDIEINAIFKMPTWTITFKVDNEVYKTVEVNKGAVYCVDFDNPEKNGFKFIGWNYDFSVAISSDITVNAEFIEIYTVTYYNNTDIVKTIEVCKDELITNDYVLDNTTDYLFTGWYTNTECSKAYDFNASVQSNVVLYAGWKDRGVDISYASSALESGKTALFYSQSIDFYDKYPWSGYTLNRGNYILFVNNVVIIDGSNTNLTPDLNASSCGVLYINNTNSSFTTTLGQTHAKILSSYSQVIGNMDGTIVSVFSTTDSTYSVTIPTGGYLWCANYNDSYQASNNSLAYSMRDITSDEVVSYTNWNEKVLVTFVSNFGDSLGEDYYMPGDDLTYPTPKEIEGYTFSNWSETISKVLNSVTIIGYYTVDGQTQCVIEVINGSGAGTYEVGSKITLVASNISNYSFSYWSDFGEKVSTNSTYSFVATASTTLVAHYIETSKLTNLVINGTNVTYRNSSVNVKIPNNYVDQGIEFRAAWVSPITGCVAKFSSVSTYKANITEMLDVLEYFNMNAVVFHIRIYNDALYLSNLNPKSSYMNTTEDMLTWVISECHARGIEFHAWMNPYRVVSSGGSSLSSIAASIKAKCPANIGSDEKYLLGNGSGVILNPGMPEVRTFLVNTCMEVIKNYDVDAIHFDDYFYISGVDDASTMALYNPNNLSQADWRRLQVDTFIEDLSSAMRAYNKTNNRYVQLGISPSGIYRNGDGVVTYDSEGNAISTGSNTGGMEHYGNYLYSDTLKWINEEWIDYIIPQSYWAFTHKTADFADVIDWWNSVALNKNVKLYAGLGIYMADGGGNYSWGTNTDELLEQLTYCTKLSNVSGACLFKFQYLRQYYKGTANSYFKNMFDALLANDWGNHALTPEVTSANTVVKLAAPTIISSNLNGNKVTITFSSVENARKYVVYRSDGELIYSGDQIVDVFGNGKTSYTVSDTLEYSSKYTYTIIAISASNTLGESSQQIIKYQK